MGGNKERKYTSFSSSTRQIDERRTTNDSGIMGNFDTSTKEAHYCEIIERILRINFRTFPTYLFECRWFEVVSRRHGSGIYMVDSTKIYKEKNVNKIVSRWVT